MSFEEAKVIVEHLSGTLADLVGKSSSASFTVVEGLIVLLVHKGILTQQDVRALLAHLKENAEAYADDPNADSRFVNAFVTRMESSFVAEPPSAN